LNLAAFYSTFRDFQTFGYFDPDGFGVGQPGVPYMINAGELESKGVEFDAQAVFNRLTLTLAGAYTDARYKEFSNALCYPFQTPAQGCSGGFQDQAGDPLYNAPKWSSNASARYDFAMPALPFDAFIGADYSWRSKVQWNTANNPATVEGAYGLLGASLGIQDKNGRYRLTAYARNLADKLHGRLTYNGPIPTRAELEQTLPDDYERIYGVSFNYRF
jgi:iron complex outermembrane receptor protein